MNSLFLISLLLIFCNIWYLANCQCAAQNIQCGNPGQACNVLVNGFQEQCDFNTALCYNSVCVGYSEGSPCQGSCGTQSNLITFSGGQLYCDSLTQVCKYRTYVQYGGNCGGNNQIQCLPAFYCNSTNNCQIYQLLGQTCSAQELCAPFLYCDQPSQTCLASFSGQAGAACTGVPACAPGLYCNGTGFCQPYSTAPTDGTTCINNGVCTGANLYPWEICACGGYNVSMTCQNPWAAAVTCQNQITAMQSCIQSSPTSATGCLKQVCAAENCITISGTNKYKYGKSLCYPSACPFGVSNSGAILAINLFMVAIIATWFTF